VNGNRVPIEKRRIHERGKSQRHEQHGETKGAHRILESVGAVEGRRLDHNSNPIGQLKSNPVQKKKGKKREKGKREKDLPIEAKDANNENQQDIGEEDEEVRDEAVDT